MLYIAIYFNAHARLSKNVFNFTHPKYRDRPSRRELYTRPNWFWLPPWRSWCQWTVCGVEGQSCPQCGLVIPPICNIVRCGSHRKGYRMYPSESEGLLKCPAFVVNLSDNFSSTFTYKNTHFQVRRLHLPKVVIPHAFKCNWMHHFSTWSSNKHAHIYSRV